MSKIKPVIYSLVGAMEAIERLGRALMQGLG